MPQINLLKQKTNSQNFWEFFPSLLVKILVVVGLCVFAYYGWLVFKLHTANSELAKVQAQILSEKAIASGMADRNELLTRQLQLQQLDSLISKHVYWTHILPELARVTLKTAIYSQIQASAAGVITATGKVPTLGDLDKYLQVFNLPEYNANFSGVRLGSYHIVQDLTGTSVGFDIKMQYNTQLLRYQKPATKNQ